MDSEHIKNITDSIIAVGTIGAVFKFLPIAVAVLTGILAVMRIVVEWSNFTTIIKKWFKKGEE